LERDRRHVAVLARQRQRHLALEVEMLLAADLDAALQAAGAAAEAVVDVAAGHAVAGGQTSPAAARASSTSRIGGQVS
jgi:hypothetical protein